MKWLKATVQKLFGRLGLVLVTSSTYDALVRKSQYARRYAILTRLMSGETLSGFSNLEINSKAQLDQDLAALAVSGMKRNGYFVEFGATDGETLSNTYLLEKQFGWTGILAEPGLEWQSKLQANRNVTISDKAVWSESGKTFEFLENSELSTLLEFKNSDQHIRKGRTYEVSTTSLNDLLDSNNAPSYIDFLSVDTEGSELEVLSAFDFSRYKFGFICVEHNYTTARQKILQLMESSGYRRVLEDVSEWDDWFVPTEI